MTEKCCDNLVRRNVQNCTHNSEENQETCDFGRKPGEGNENVDSPGERITFSSIMRGVIIRQ